MFMTAYIKLTFLQLKKSAHNLLRIKHKTDSKYRVWEETQKHLIKNG